jgi:hypothetical protein
MDLHDLLQGWFYYTNNKRNNLISLIIFGFYKILFKNRAPCQIFSDIWVRYDEGLLYFKSFLIFEWFFNIKSVYSGGL